MTVLIKQVVPIKRIKKKSKKESREENNSDRQKEKIHVSIAF